MRKAPLCAICAFTLICALAPSAGALPDSAGSTTTDKPASTNKTATPSAVHKSTATSRTQSSSSSNTHTSSSRKRSARKKTARVRGQQKIDPERAQAIQQALIREHYLTAGTPTGEWNEASEAAMRHYQEDNGWQTVVVPDSRALIKLGLGPSKDHLLNPESAMTTVPDAPKAQPGSSAPQTASGVSNPAAPAAAPTTPLQNTPSSPQ